LVIIKIKGEKAMEIRLNLDARGRVNLAKLLPNIEDIHTVRAYTEGNKIILEPMAEIPAHELWLHQNPDALLSVQRGIKQAEQGKLRTRAAYSKNTGKT
jgi:hypothetical protein